MPTDVTKNFVWVRKTRRRMDKRSFRVKKREGGRTLLRFACPKGKWKARRKRCAVPMQLEAIAHRRK